MHRIISEIWSTESLQISKSWVQDRKNAGSARVTFTKNGNFSRVQIGHFACHKADAASWKGTIYIEMHYRSIQ